MPFHKVTWEFEATVGVTATSGSKAGWSESWYDCRDSSDDVAMDDASRAADGRRAILTPGWSLTSVRVSRLSSANTLERRGRHFFFAPGVAPGTYPGTAQDEQPYDALIIGCNTQSGLSRSRPIRGIPQEIVNAGGRYLGPATFRARFADFQRMLSNQPAGDWGLDPVNYGFRIRSAFPQGALRAVSLVPVGDSFASPQQPFLTGAFDIGPTFGPGTTVLIRGAQGMSRLNGDWVIDQVLSATEPCLFRLRPKRRTTVIGTYTGGGQITFITYSLDPMVGASAEYGSSRDTGRPLQLHRGRRSARVS